MGVRATWGGPGLSKNRKGKLEGPEAAVPSLVVAGSSLGTGWHFLPSQVTAWLQDGLWAMLTGSAGKLVSLAAHRACKEL